MKHVKALCFGLFLLLAAPISVTADQRDARLDDLFARLQKPDDAVPTKLVEAQIWNIWLKSESDTVNLLMHQGIAAMSNGDNATAYDAFSSITDLAPDFSEGWNKRATVLYIIGQYQQSAADCLRVLELEPRHFGALSGLGLIFTALDEPEKALDAYERVLEVYPTNGYAKAQAKALRKQLKGEKI
jgi:tetratricopeptide (TPR) repeat protein